MHLPTLCILCQNSTARPLNHDSPLLIYQIGNGFALGTLIIVVTTGSLFSSITDWFALMTLGRMTWLLI